MKRSERKMNPFCFTVDDNILFLRDLARGEYESLFDHPYLSMYKRLHEKHGLKIQLNLFYEMPGFDLSRMPDRFRGEWEKNASWLKLSFHSRLENENPYLASGYEEVYSDCEKVQREILRFAGIDSLGKTTTVHWCRATEEGVKALFDQGVRGLLGLYGTEEKPLFSYDLSAEEGKALRKGEFILKNGMAHYAIDVIMNKYGKEELLEKVSALLSRSSVRIMIHEQYFYPDYHAFQPDFEEKIDAAFSLLRQAGFESRFLEETEPLHISF